MSEENHSLTIHLTKPLVKKAALLALLTKKIFIVMVLWLGMVFLVTYLSLEHTSRYLPLVITPLVLFPVVVFIKYLQAISLSEQSLKKLTSRTQKLNFTAEGVAAFTDVAQSKADWKAFFKLIKGRDVWLLMPSPINFYMLPTSDLGDELKAFIQSKLKENKIPIIEEFLL